MGFNKEKFMEFVVEEPVSMFNPMNMVYSYGCMANELSVNGVNEVDMTDSQRQNVIESHRMCKKQKRNRKVRSNEILKGFLLKGYVRKNTADVKNTAV